MTKNQKKKAFGYIRVSTAMQVEGGYSLDDQENRIRQHAKANDMTLVDIFRDEGKSGKNISGRPGFQKMLEAIRNGQKIDYVLVTRLSRFGRNASDVMTALKTLQSHGVALWCIEDMLDSSTKMGDAMLKMSSIFAEMERENIREQTRAGRYEKARQGKWNGGQAPYGYQIGRNADGTSSGVLVVDKDEAKVVRQIFDWYVNDNVGIAGISTRLNENGVRRTPRGNGSQSFFTPYAVKKIIENPVYAGKIRYGVRKSTLVEGSDNVYRPKAQDDYKVYEGLHEAIVDDDTFRRAKERRDRESVAFPRKRDNHVSILSGLLVCPVCGHGLISTHTKGRTKKDGTPGKDTYGYRCRYTRKSHGAICTFTKQIPQHVLHEEADELFEMIWRDTNLFGQVIEDADKAMDMKKLKDEAERLTKLISGCDRRISKLSETIDRLDPDDSAYDRKYDDMQARLDSLYEEREHLEDDKADVDDKLAARNDLRDTIERVANDVTRVLNGLYQMSDEEKAVLYHQMFEHFELNPDADYRKGERVIKKAFLRVPITYGDESVDAFVPGDGSGSSWVPDNSRVKDDIVETVCLLARDTPAEAVTRTYRA